MADTPNHSITRPAVEKMPGPSHSFSNATSPRQAFIGTGHLLQSVSRGRRGGGASVMPGMAGGGDGEDYTAGGSGGVVSHAEPKEQATEQHEPEHEQPEGQPLGRPAGKPYTGQHRPQASTPVDYVGRMEDSLGDNLDGPRRTSYDPQTGHYAWGEPQVIRPGSLPATSPDHPLMSNFRHIMEGLQEPK
jgi:hypothetical protein